MAVEFDLPPLEDVGPPPADQTPPAEVWKIDRQGREYAPRKDGRSGNVFRQGEESIAQARERDTTAAQGAGGDKRPKRKPKRPKMPDAPRKVDLKELEATIAEALKAPAMPAAMFGDEWAANHFTMSGPYLARNLVLASEHNPWLRMKLEQAATGGDAMMKMVSLVGVGGALFGYAIPPIVYWFNLPVPAKTREMFGIPPRREREPEYAASAQGPEYFAPDPA